MQYNTIQYNITNSTPSPKHPILLSSLPFYSYFQRINPDPDAPTSSQPTPSPAGPSTTSRPHPWTRSPPSGSAIARGKPSNYRKWRRKCWRGRCCGCYFLLVLRIGRGFARVLRGVGCRCWCWCWCWWSCAYAYRSALGWPFVTETILIFMYSRNMNQRDRIIISNESMVRHVGIYMVVGRRQQVPVWYIKVRVHRHPVSWWWRQGRFSPGNDGKEVGYSRFSIGFSGIWYEYIFCMCGLLVWRGMWFIMGVN